MDSLFVSRRRRLDLYRKMMLFVFYTEYIELNRIEENNSYNVAFGSCMLCYPILIAGLQ